MSAKFPIHWYTHQMTGLEGGMADAAGTFYAFFKTIMIEGFNTKNPVSIDYSSADNDLTLVYAEDHGYIEYQIIEISGADQAEYNDQFRVSEVVDANTLKVKLEPGDAAPVITTATTQDVFATKCPPNGEWELIEDDPVNFQIALRPTRVDRARCIYIFQNTSDWNWSVNNGKFIRLRLQEKDWEGFDSISSVATLYWPYTNRYSSIGILFLVSRDQIHYFNRYAYNGRTSGHMVGQFESTVPGDKYNVTWVTGRFYNSTHSSYYWSDAYDSYHNDGAMVRNYSTGYRGVMRGYDQYPGTDGCDWIGLGDGSGRSISYPNPANYGYYVLDAPCIIRENSSIRGYLYGRVWPLHTYSSFFYTVREDYPGFEGIPIINWPVQDSNQGYSDAQRSIMYRLDKWEP